MRKFKLFSYLLIAGITLNFDASVITKVSDVLFHNVSKFTPLVQHVNWQSYRHFASSSSAEEVGEGSDSIEIVKPFYYGPFKNLFSPQDDIRKKRLADFINELFPNAISDYRLISPLVQEIRSPNSSSPKGRLTVDIPFSVQDGNKKVIYNIEMQQKEEDGIELRLKEYRTELQHSTKEYDSATMIGLLGAEFDNDAEVSISEAEFDIASGEYKAKSEDGIRLFLLKTDYYSSKKSKIVDKETRKYKKGSYFNGTKLPDNGWMAFFDECARIVKEMKSSRGRTVRTIRIPSTHNNYKPIIKDAIDSVLDSQLGSNEEIIKTLEKQDKMAREGVDHREKIQIATNMLKDGIPHASVVKYCGISTEEVEQIAKELKLSYQQGSGSLPTSTK